MESFSILNLFVEYTEICHATIYTVTAGGVQQKQDQLPTRLFLGFRKINAVFFQADYFLLVERSESLLKRLLTAMQ